QETRLTRRASSAPLVEFKTLLQKAPSSAITPEPIDPDTMAILIYSGGTTGSAKGITLSHYNLVANACQVAAWGHMNEEGRILAVLPLFHGFGMSVTMNSPVMQGGTLILMPRFNAQNVLKAIQKYRPTFFIGVPTMFVALSNLPDLQRYDLSSLKGVFVG